MHMTESTKSSLWKPGQSGNPDGKKPGTGLATKLRAAIEKDIPAIIDTLVIAAKGGDVAASRLLIERVFPAMKPIEMPAPMNMPAGSLADQGRAVVAAAGSGELAPGQAAQLLSGLGALAKIIETDELERRIAALESKQ